MRIKIPAILFVTLLCLNACSEKGDFDVAKAAYERKDYEAALKEFKLLAEDGNAEAQYYLGGLYFKQGTRSDYAKAYALSSQWYLKAAEQGHIAAQRQMGGHYTIGYGVREDAVRAAYWYLKAAEQGDAMSQRWLGYMYMHGYPGVKRDVVAAYAFLNVALSKRNSSDKEVDQIDAAQSLAQDDLNQLTRSMMSPEEHVAGQILTERMTSPGAVLSEVLAQHKLPKNPD